jgi:phosphohistidine phosphatase
MRTMARQLWLLRHADAEPHGTRPDPERLLTERGERQARLVGLALARMGVEFDGVLCSPKERALRTATLALGDRLEVHQALAEGLDSEQALAAMADAIPPALTDGRLLLVGHEPDFSNVVWELTGARIDLKKGGLAVVRVESSPRAGANGLSGGVGGGELVLLLRPRELALIADLAVFDV